MSDQPLIVEGVDPVPPVTEWIDMPLAPDYFGIFIPRGVPDEVVATVDSIWAEQVMNSEAIKTYAETFGAVFAPVLRRRRPRQGDADRHPGGLLGGRARRGGQSAERDRRRLRDHVGSASSSGDEDARARTAGASRPSSRGATPPTSCRASSSWLSASPSSSGSWTMPRLEEPRRPPADRAGARARPPRAGAPPLRRSARRGRLADRRPRRRARGASRAGTRPGGGPRGDGARAGPRLHARPRRLAAVLARHRALRLRLHRRLRARARAGAAEAARAPSPGPPRSRSWPASPWCWSSSAASSSGCRRESGMFEGLSYLGQGLASILTPLSILNVAWATLLGITIGILPGLTATMGVALLVTFTYPMAARPGDPDADVRLHRRDLRRQPHGDPAQHPRHPGQRRDDARRLPAGPPGQGRARHGPRHHLLGARHPGRRLLPRAARAAARRGGAEVPVLRVLLARPLRRADLRPDDRLRQPAQGLHRRHPRPPGRDDRHGEPARLPALHLRHRPRSAAAST